MCTKTKIISSFKNTVEKHRLIEENDTIIVGASGGPDSQFLIYLLNELKDFYKIDIVLAHLNHMHREDAIDDENLVIETGKKLSLKTFISHKSMDDYAKEKKISSENSGRILRYEFFNSLKKNYKNAKIAVAHNMDDQAETVLMRIIRGSGLDGLKAMDYKNASIIRPIMDFKKSQILKFLDDNKIAYHIDYTNLQRDYTRNKIRLDIIPQIEKINPNFKKSLVNLSEVSKNDYEILKEIEDETLKKVLVTKEENKISFDKSQFEKLSDSLKMRLIRRAIFYLYEDIKDFSKTNIEELLKIVRLDTGKKIIKNKLVLQKNYNTYDFFIKEEENKEKNQKEIYLNTNDENIFDSFKFKTSIISYESYRKIDKNKREFFALDDLDGISIKIRYRINGDYFTYLKNGKRKKLKNYFIDEKVDKNLRDKIPLLFINDKLCLIVGKRRSEDFRISEKSKKILMVSVEEL